MNANAINLPCPVCTGPLTTRYQGSVPGEPPRNFTILGCAACGHGVTLAPAAGHGEAHDGLYAENRHAFTEHWCARRRARWVQQRNSAGAPRRVLDVGCGNGAFLRAMQRANWQVAGVEREQRASALQHLHVGTSLDEAAEHAPFGAVTLWHSLEHFEDPATLLRECRALLHPAGAVFIAVPDARSLAARLFGRHWLHLDVPRHRHHFTARSLALALQDAGFSSRATLGPEFEYEWLGWSQSSLDALGLPHHAFFDALRGVPRHGGLPARILHLALGGVACGLTLAPAACAALAPQPCHLVCTASAMEASPPRPLSH